MTKLPFLWRVEIENRVSHLLGTAHLLNEDELFELARPLVEMADTVYVETPEDFALEKRHYELPEGQTIDGLLDKPELNDLILFFGEQYKGIMSGEAIKSHLAKRKLWHITSEVDSLFYCQDEVKYFVARGRIGEMTKDSSLIGSLISLPVNARIQRALQYRQEIITLLKIVQGYESQHKEAVPTLDNMIRLYAKSVGKNITGLDTPDEYAAIHDDVSIKSQKSRLFRTIEDFKQGKLLNDDEESAYRSADLNRLLAYLEPETEEAREFSGKVGYGRTNLWYPKTLSSFKGGNLLVAIGTAHIVGEEGYIARLEKDGFNVVRI